MKEGYRGANHSAAVKHTVKPDVVERILARRHNWPGARNLRRVIWGDEPVSLSKLESSFIARLKQGDLPLPKTNRRTRPAWEQDRQREREASARGDEFRRYSWRDVVEEPKPMLADLRALLTRQLALAA